MNCFANVEMKGPSIWYADNLTHFDSSSRKLASIGDRILRRWSSDTQHAIDTITSAQDFLTVHIGSLQRDT